MSRRRRMMGGVIGSLLSGNNNKLWLDASDTSTITQSSGSVSQWNDKSGNGNNATQATGTAQFAYNATGLNGKPALISASGDSMALGSTVSLTGEFSIFIVNSRAALATMMLLGNSSQNTKIGITTDPAGRAFVRAVNLGASDTTQTFPGLNVPNICEVTRDSANKVDSAFDGASLNRLFSDAAQVSTFGINRVGLDDFTGHWQGAISEIILFDRSLTPSERTVMNAYLSNKWGI